MSIKSFHLGFSGEFEKRSQSIRTKKTELYLALLSVG